MYLFWSLYAETPSRFSRAPHFSGFDLYVSNTSDTISSSQVTDILGTH